MISSIPIDVAVGEEITPAFDGLLRVPCTDPRPAFKIGPADELTQTQPSIGEPCLPWILTKLSRQPDKAERTREILQRAMAELVELEAE